MRSYHLSGSVPYYSRFDCRWRCFPWGNGCVFGDDGDGGGRQILLSSYHSDALYSKDKL